MRYPGKRRCPPLTGYPPILEYRVTRRLTRLQREAYDLIGYTLQLTQTHSETKQGRKIKWSGITQNKHTVTHHSKLRTTDDYTRLSMPRRVQRSIWRLKMRCPTYSQVTTRQPLRCRWCDEDYDSITMHWLRHCPAMMYWQERMAARLKEHGCDLDDREAITAILNSQNAVDYEEINGLLQNFPLPEPNS